MLVSLCSFLLHPFSMVCLCFSFSLCSPFLLSSRVCLVWIFSGIVVDTRMYSSTAVEATQYDLTVYVLPEFALLTESIHCTSVNARPFCAVRDRRQTRLWN